MKKPYGYLVIYERQTVNGLERASFRRKGSEAKARRAAVFKINFVRVVELDPYTQEQWIRCFGEGRM